MHFDDFCCHITDDVCMDSVFKTRVSYTVSCSKSISCVPTFGFSHCYYLPTRRYSLLSTIGMFAVCTKYRSGRILLHSWIRAHKQRGRKYNGWIFPVFTGLGGGGRKQHLMFNSESLKVIENDSLCKINLFREVSIHVYVFNLDKTINVMFMQMEQEYSGLNLPPFKIKFKASRLVSLCWWRKLQSS